MNLDLDKVVAVYVKIRDERSRITKEYETKDEELKAKQEKLEEVLLSTCKDMNVDSLKTAHGTATRTVKERIWAPDADAFKAFVREHDALDLFETRIHQGNFKLWAAEHQGVVAPVNIDRRYAITVRRK